MSLTRARSPACKNGLPDLRLLPDAPVPDGRTVPTNPDTDRASRRSWVTGSIPRLSYAILMLSRPVGIGPPSRRLNSGPLWVGGHRSEAGCRRGRESLSESCGQGRERRWMVSLGRLGVVSAPAGWDRRVERRSGGLRAVGAAGCLPGFGVSGGWAAAEVAVAEAVAVALEAEDFGVVDEPVDHGGGGGRGARDSRRARGRAG